MTEGRPTGPTGRTLIRDALIITVDDQDRVLDPGDLLIEDGRIAYVGPALPDGTHRQGPFERDIDGRRLVVMPGFINAHTHTYATLFKGSYQQVPLDLWLIAMRAPTKLLSEELLELSALISGVEMLKSGTTTALDHFFGNPGLPQSGIGAEVRSMQRLGMRHAVAYVVMDLHWEDTLPLPADTASRAGGAVAGVNALETAQKMDGAAAFIETYHRRHPLTTCLIGPSAAHRCSDDLLRQTRELATATDSGIHMHLGQEKSHALRNYQMFGDSLIARIDRLGVLGPDVSMAHGVWINDDELDRLARSGATIVHNPASDLKLGSGIARIPEMLERGVQVAVSTDGACSSDNLNMFEATRLAGLLHTSNMVDYSDWPSAARVLRMATRDAARAVRHEGQLGALQQGWIADVVTLKRDSVHWAALNDPLVQLVYCEDGTSVDRVFVSGNEVVSDGRVTGIDELDLYRAVGEARAALDPQVRQAHADMEPIEGPIRDMWRTIQRMPVPDMELPTRFR
jgi:cytosine/adenosine deaminase-related metal-dependent hydrolase